METPTIKPEVLTRAASEMGRFYDALEGRVKRFPPEQYAVAVAQRLKLMPDMNALSTSPPHWLLHALEATCFYHRKQHLGPISKVDFFRAMRPYFDFDDALGTYWLRDACELTPFVLTMHRQQMEIQQINFGYDTARAMCLLVNDPVMTGIDAIMARVVGITCKQWIYLCLNAFIATNLNPNSMMRSTALERVVAWETPPPVVKRFLSLSTQSSSAVGESYIVQRRRTRPLFHWCIRSAFLSSPLILFASGEYCAPLPTLLIRHASVGLLQLAKKACKLSIPDDQNFFSDRFSKSMENYLSRVCSEAIGLARMIGAEELKRSAKGRKSCDLFLELDDCYVLIECKGTSLATRDLSPDLLVTDPSTRQIRKAWSQLCGTALDIENGCYPSISPTKPIVGIVATYGDIPEANSAWYLKNIIAEGSPEALEFAPLHGRPLILSIEVVEELISALRIPGATILQLVNEKTAASEYHTGDWQPFLENKLSAARINHPAILQQALASIWLDLGVPPQNA